MNRKSLFNQIMKSRRIKSLLYEVTVWVPDKMKPIGTNYSKNLWEFVVKFFGSPLRALCIPDNLEIRHPVVLSRFLAIPTGAFNAEFSTAPIQLSVQLCHQVPFTYPVLSRRESISNYNHHSLFSFIRQKWHVRTRRRHRQVSLVLFYCGMVDPFDYPLIASMNYAQ